jgi:MerR family Zn(II)-responsive transcriptional regulator of zntA
MSGRLYIGRVAKETGFSTDAIRFYERQGLLGGLAKSEGGYRLFDDNCIHDLKFIRKSKELGFSLNEIREMLILRRASTPGCSHVRDIILTKLVLVEAKIQELVRLREELRSSLRKCNRDLKRSGSLTEKPCPVLKQLGGSNGNHGV